MAYDARRGPRLDFAMPTSSDGSDRDRGAISPQEREEFRKRSEDLGRKLEAARGEATKHDAGRSRSGDSGQGEAVGRALRISTELIGGVVVGSGIGWGLDKWLGTWPLLFIVFFLLGSAAGMLNVVRSGLRMKTGPNNPNAGPSVRDDEDDA